MNKPAVACRFGAAIFLAGFVSCTSATTRAQTSPATQPTSFKFSFGAETPPGYTHIDASARYSPTIPIGFENLGGAFPNFVGTDTNNPLHSGYLTAPAPFFFSCNVPEGNYRVTVTLGGADSLTTVKAELRRLMLEQIPTTAESTITKTFAVNIRKPPILDASGKQTARVRVVKREIQQGSPWNGLNRTPGGEGFSWDDALTLEFSGKPALVSLSIERDDAVHTLFLAGDSTVCDQPAAPFTSWGQVITRWLKPDFAVSNVAISGETSAGFYGENRMAKIVSQLRPGDYVFVQFGHNDMKSTAANALATYKQNYTRFVTDTRAKGATPVLFTPVSRETFGRDGKITNSFITNRGDDYVQAAREVAAEQKATLIDLNAISIKFYETLGPGKCQIAFANPQEKTHHSDYGAYEIAQCVLQAIIDAKLPLAKSISEDFKGYDPTHPDDPAKYTIPLEPIPKTGTTGSASPDGN